jgi:hypothetical protein
LTFGPTTRRLPVSPLADKGASDLGAGLGSGVKDDDSCGAVLLGGMIACVGEPYLETIVSFFVNIAHSGEKSFSRAADAGSARERVIKFRAMR